MGLFSSEPSAIEKAVIRATDENLTTEDWMRIIEVCDTVNEKPSKHGPQAVEALRKRLALPNGNVQLYSLTLLNALAQNCGAPAQREIASAATADVLSGLGTRSTTHRAVVVRLIDILDQLATQFAADTTLSQIRLVYERVCRSHPSLAGSKQAGAGSGSGSHGSQARVGGASRGGAPANGTHHSSRSTHNNHSNNTTNNNDDDEDEDLRRALELSLREMGQPQAEIEAAAHRPLEPRHQVRALYDFTASEDGELTFRTGDVIEVIDRVYKEWWKGVLHGREGIFPVNYVEAIGEPLPQDDADESASAVSVGGASYSGYSVASAAPSVMDESYIFGQVPAVEKLLSILVSASQTKDGSSIISNHDIQQLYHQIASMRPRLIQLIDEYTVKKQELVDMNQKLMLAHRAYERLLADAASGQYRQPQAPAAAPAAAPLAAPLAAPSAAPSAAPASHRMSAGPGTYAVPLAGAYAASGHRYSQSATPQQLHALPQQGLQSLQSLHSLQSQPTQGSQLSHAPSVPAAHSSHEHIPASASHPSTPALPSSGPQTPVPHAHAVQSPQLQQQQFQQAQQQQFQQFPHQHQHQHHPSSWQAQWAPAASAPGTPQWTQPSAPQPSAPQPSAPQPSAPQPSGAAAPAAHYTPQAVYYQHPLAAASAAAYAQPQAFAAPIDPAARPSNSDTAYARPVSTYGGHRLPYPDDPRRPAEPAAALSPYANGIATAVATPQQ